MYGAGNNMKKKDLHTNQIYHVFTKSIFKFIIFRNKEEFERMIDLIWFYKKEKPPIRYSAFLQLKDKEVFLSNNSVQENNLVQIIAYCIMPTHIHLILKQLKDGGISLFLGNVLNSYSRYFNSKTKRKGPLWESRFKSVSVDTDEQLLHLTRYVHLNPVTAYLVKKPEEWKYSSYTEYTDKNYTGKEICNYQGLMDIKSIEYKEFVNSQIEHQRELASIKSKLFD
jgi:putative transposase